MLNEAQMKSVALFFFYSCMDESEAFEATTKTIEKCRKRLSRGTVSNDDMAAIIVNYTYQAWKKWQASPSRAHLSVLPEVGWILAPNANFGAWQDFRKSADTDEFLAIVWSRLLKLTDEQIAKGLGVTVGTIRHRVGRGLRHLGRVRKGTKK